MDIKVPNECKLGMTTRPLYKRVTETGNPDYMIIKSYYVPPEEAKALEKHLQREVGKSYRRKVHFITGKNQNGFFVAQHKLQTPLNTTSLSAYAGKMSLATQTWLKLRSNPAWITGC